MAVTGHHGPPRRQEAWRWREPADVVQQGLIAMESNLTSEQLGSIMFSHPTVSEALHEAVLSSKGKAIHLNNRKRK